MWGQWTVGPKIENGKRRRTYAAADDCDEYTTIHAYDDPRVWNGVARGHTPQRRRWRREGCECRGVCLPPPRVFSTFTASTLYCAPLNTAKYRSQYGSIQYHQYNTRNSHRRPYRDQIMWFTTTAVDRSIGLQTHNDRESQTIFYYLRTTVGNKPIIVCLTRSIVISRVRITNYRYILSLPGWFPP